jgi:hypothetical protein
MKDCTHKQQEVLATTSHIRTQVCIPCGTVLAKWDIQADKLVYNLPPSKTPVFGIEDQAVS